MPGVEWHCLRKVQGITALKGVTGHIPGIYQEGRGSGTMPNMYDWRIPGVDMHVHASMLRVQVAAAAGQAIVCVGHAGKGHTKAVEHASISNTQFGYHRDDKLSSWHRRAIRSDVGHMRWHWRWVVVAGRWFQIPVCLVHGPQINIELSDGRSTSSARLSSPPTLADDTLLITVAGAAWD